jgi:hypothetical protein
VVCAHESAAVVDVEAQTAKLEQWPEEVFSPDATPYLAFRLAAIGYTAADDVIVTLQCRPQAIFRRASTSCADVAACTAGARRLHQPERGP